MSEAPRLQNSENEPLPPSQNNELNEIAWQKWIERNKDHDAAYRKKVDPDTLARVLVLVVAVRTATLQVSGVGRHRQMSGLSQRGRFQSNR